MRAMAWVAPAGRIGVAMGLACAIVALPPAARGASPPANQRGTSQSERVGHHDANNIRTRYWNYGMVGDYPTDPLGVDLSVFHSAEVPKGSGMNYTDGITPFVLSKIRTLDGQDAYIMETGYRERQGISPQYNRAMRFEPRPGFFEADPSINQARAPAISNDPRTWPSQWPDKLTDPFDPGWPKSWNGYFGKRPAADQESFSVMDDEYYDAWPQYYPDANDLTRKGLGLRVQVRGFQWSNPQAGNVIFWHYDVTNEGTVNYDDNVIFGLYMDSGVGGSAVSCDGIAESDDDNAYWDRSYAQSGSRLNLVYTWDRFGRGVDLSGPCGRTGYLGYAYLETPGNPFDGLDNDDDGVVDEQRDGGPGQRLDGADAVRLWIEAHYDTAKFYRQYGRLERLPAYRAEVGWSGDEDFDWEPEFSDVGADGVPDTHDPGEGDGIPTEGEPNFDRTDLNESDQIGLTGFKLNRIKQGQGNPDPTTDNVLFYTEASNWPSRLWQKFTSPYVPDRFDSALAANYNLGFLFASGPFKLKAGQTERFSLALAYGADLTELRNTVGTVQLIYNANYQFAVPPTAPKVTAEPGDGFVRLSWDDAAERSVDPVTHERDFEGYNIYRSTDPEFRDLEVITTGRGNDIGLRKPTFQMDLANGRRGYTKKTVEGISYYMGDDTGITHTWTDSSVTNGQEYYYTVDAYDRGVEPVPYADSAAVFPSQNPISAITRTLRGGVILPSQTIRVRPNPRVFGWQPAEAEAPAHVAGTGKGAVTVQVVNSDLVPEGHDFRISFHAPAPESIKAETYGLTDLSNGTTFFESGADFDGLGIGPAASGLLPVVHATLARPEVDTLRSGYGPANSGTTRLKVAYQPVLSPNLRRPGYPDSIRIEFADTVQDTALARGVGFQALEANFRVFAETDSGDVQLDFRFRDGENLPDPQPDVPPNGFLDRANEFIDIATYAYFAPGEPQWTYRVSLDPRGLPIQGPRAGDVYHIKLNLPLGAADAYQFSTHGARVDRALAGAASSQEPYVVPNPYVEAASFEPSRFGVSGRGERRMEFRGLAQGSTIRIYTVRGDLVRTLRQDGSTAGFVAWDLRTKDNLEVAPGLYLFHVEAPGMKTHVGKFAIIK